MKSKTLQNLQTEAHNRSIEIRLIYNYKSPNNVEELKFVECICLRDVVIEVNGWPDFIM